ncbi:MAG: type II toxin-antitoxin system HicA family toxin [Chloroflexi bacterium]|nr:type II toxin-antitoxin system HicA family toxin [Chloroflexota bacterium]
MKLPRDISGDDLIKRLGTLGFSVIRQTGSHARLAIGEEYRITVPRHKSLRVGTLNGIINEVAEQLGVTKGELIKRLWK